MSEEAGYQYLPTGYTGTYIPQLSGNDLFPIVSSDQGSFNTLNDSEIR